MKRKRVLNLCMLIFGLLVAWSFTSALEGAPPLEADLVIVEADRPDLIQHQKTVVFKGQGYFFVREVHFKDALGDYVTSFTIPGKEGVVQYYESKHNLKIMPLADGFLPIGTLLNIRTDRYHMILGQAYSYEDLGSGTILATSGDSPIHCKREGEHWVITYRLKKVKNQFGIIWGVGSMLELMDLSKADVGTVWSGNDLSINNRIGYDGYYYKSPASYLPSAINSYWRIPSMYLANALIKKGGCLGYDLLANGLLHIAKENLNEEGYFPTLPESVWLKEDYAVGAGFFDTRFNADAGETLLLAHQKFGIPLYRELYLKAAAYYTQHAVDHHFEIEKDGVVGWLVEDYGSSDGVESFKTHVSLNHQLQALKWFLKLYEAEKEIQYNDMAQKLLDGIKLTAHLWLKSDGNLEYAYMPDGTMGLVDYDYLTYNDLFDVQQLLETQRGQRDPNLDVLMISKKQWMDLNQIHRYTQ